MQGGPTAAVELDNPSVSSQINFGLLQYTNDAFESCLVSVFTCVGDVPALAKIAVIHK